MAKIYQRQEPKNIAKDYYIEDTRIIICTDECVPDGQIDGILEKIGKIISRSKRKEPQSSKTEEVITK